MAKVQLALLWTITKRTDPCCQVSYRAQAACRSNSTQASGYCKVRGFGANPRTRT